MGAIPSIGDSINISTGGGAGIGQKLSFMKVERVGAAAAPATIANKLHSLWAYDGQPSDGATPTTVLIPDNTTVGGMRQATATAGRTNWLTGVKAFVSQSGTLLVCDRLLQIGGLDGTVLTAQNVGGTITRNTAGVGNRIWVVINTQIGASATTITASYTNQAGAAGQTTQATAIGGTGNREATRIIELPLAQGDYGVQAVASVTLAGTTGTAGNISVVLARVVAELPVNAGCCGSVNLLGELPGPQDVTGACLFFGWFSTTTTAPMIAGSMTILEN